MDTISKEKEEFVLRALTEDTKQTTLADEFDDEDIEFECSYLEVGTTPSYLEIEEGVFVPIKRARSDDDEDDAEDDGEDDYNNVVLALTQGYIHTSNVAPPPQKILRCFDDQEYQSHDSATSTAVISTAAVAFVSTAAVAFDN